jgi:hypothetical protein
MPKRKIVRHTSISLPISAGLLPNTDVTLLLLSSPDRRRRTARQGRSGHKGGITAGQKARLREESGGEEGYSRAVERW